MPRGDSTPPLIDFRCLSVMRGDKLVLRDLNLRIELGEHVAILGPNGCGKSTLIQTITRDLYPLEREGSFAAILGSERWNVADLRFHLGIVSNDLMAFCTREIIGRDAVLSGFFSSAGVWPHHRVTSGMRRKTQELLELLEVPHLAERMVTEMSSGEARRILIARALVHDPRALLFDEPSNSLDLLAQHELRSIMRKLAASGITLVLVTHHLMDVIPEIDRVILMSAGRIVADGPKTELLERERLRAVFGVRLELAQHDGYYHIW
ncbi:MAG TPA: ATP-binding cassette domain-containing protein [Terriglobales bacterium]|nr:ATP-binding cassette domain-containing protein [Terriglobales bacterium]